MATVALFGFDQAGFSVWWAVVAGWINSLEEIVITLILLTWTHDVLSLGPALQLRDRTLSQAD